MQIKDYFTFTEKIVADYLGGEPAAENLWYEEILYRTAINRLHFGIFLLVAERFHVQFLTAEQKQRCHSVIRKQARSSTNPKFANSYESLEALREQADYYTGSKIEHAHYLQAKNIADYLLEAIENESTSFMLDFMDEEEEFSRKHQKHK